MTVFTVPRSMAMSCALDAKRSKKLMEGVRAFNWRGRGEASPGHVGWRPRRQLSREPDRWFPAFYRVSTRFRRPRRSGACRRIGGLLPIGHLPHEHAELAPRLRDRK